MTALPAIQRKNTLDPDMDADYSTSLSCDGGMRGAEGATTSAPLTVL